MSNFVLEHSNTMRIGVSSLGLSLIFQPIRYTSRQLSTRVHSIRSNLEDFAMNGKQLPRKLRWVDLDVATTELKANATLNMGQCFNWKDILIGDQQCWLGMIGNHSFLVRQLTNTTEYMYLSEQQSDLIVPTPDVKTIMREYFQLDYCLAELYSQWEGGCDRMKVVTQHLDGVRVVRQEPWECLISFICSSNNNIARITQMLDKLRYRYGKYSCSLVCTDNPIEDCNWIRTPLMSDQSPSSSTGTSSTSSNIESNRSADENERTSSWMVYHPIDDSGASHPPDFSNFEHGPLDIQLSPNPTAARTSKQQPQNSRHHHQLDLYEFPTPEALAGATEEELRAMGMGYRAKFIIGTAQLVLNKSRDLKSLEGGNIVENPTKQKKEKHDFGAKWDEINYDSASWLYYLRSLAGGENVFVPFNDKTSGGRSSQRSSSSSSSSSSSLKSVKRENIDTETATATSSPTVVMTSNCQHPDERSSGSKLAEAGAAGTGDKKEVKDSRLYVQEQLMELPGVGRKVADCVALFSLDQTAAIPVDTHVWNIAIRDYAPELRSSNVILDTPSPSPSLSQPLSTPVTHTTTRPPPPAAGAAASPIRRICSSSTAHTSAMDPTTTAGSTAEACDCSTPAPDTVAMIETKSLTPGVYEAVGNVFRSRFGAFAGWAHSVLFAAELPLFRSKLPETMQYEMKLFADQQRSAKKLKREQQQAKKDNSEGGVITTGSTTSSKRKMTPGVKDIKTIEESPGTSRKRIDRKTPKSMERTEIKTKK